MTFNLAFRSISSFEAIIFHGRKPETLCCLSGDSES